MVVPPILSEKKIAKDSLNIENLMQTFENLLPKLLNKIFRYCKGLHQIFYVQTVAPPILTAN